MSYDERWTPERIEWARTELVRLWETLTGKRERPDFDPDHISTDKNPEKEPEKKIVTQFREIQHGWHIIAEGVYDWETIN